MGLDQDVHKLNVPGHEIVDIEVLAPVTVARPRELIVQAVDHKPLPAVLFRL
ncbi:MAG: hypothetical protein QF719_00175 [Chloroflexota bacterium]|nr:hypothetical protein [Chloroflexota bacterium]